MCFVVYSTWVYCCRSGICIWAASYPGNAASVRSGTVSFVGSLSRGSGIRYILVDFLRSQSDEHVSALSWSPDGRYPYKCQRVFFILPHPLFSQKWILPFLFFLLVRDAAVWWHYFFFFLSNFKLLVLNHLFLTYFHILSFCFIWEFLIHCVGCCSRYNGDLCLLKLLIFYFESFYLLNDDTNTLNKLKTHSEFFLVFYLNCSTSNLKDTKCTLSCICLQPSLMT